jgi:hypothetical protein
MGSSRAFIIKKNHISFVIRLNLSGVGFWLNGKEFTQPKDFQPQVNPLFSLCDTGRIIKINELLIEGQASESESDESDVEIEFDDEIVSIVLLL